MLNVPNRGLRLVRQIYLDEAGTSANDTHAVVAGPVVHADSVLIPLQNHIRSIVEEFIPAPDQAGFVFHMTDIWNNGKYFKDKAVWPWERRKPIVDALVAIPKRFELPVVSQFCVRSEFQERFPALCSKSTKPRKSKGGAVIARAIIAALAALYVFGVAEAAERIGSDALQKEHVPLRKISEDEADFVFRAVDASVLNGAVKVNAGWLAPRNVGVRKEQFRHHRPGDISPIERGCRPFVRWRYHNFHCSGDFAGVPVRHSGERTEANASLDLCYYGRRSAIVERVVGDFEKGKFPFWNVEPAFVDIPQCLDLFDKDVGALDIKQSLFGDVGAAPGMDGGLSGIDGSGNGGAKSHEANDGASQDQPIGLPSPIRRLLSSIGSLPLGAKVGIAIVLSSFAGLVGVIGFVGALDLRLPYRRRASRGLLILLGLCLFCLPAAFWW